MLRMRIPKLKKQAFSKSSEKIRREIEQLELALEDLLIASAEIASTPADDDEADAVLEVTTGDIDEGKPRRRPRVSATPREIGGSSTWAAAAWIAAVSCGSWAKT